MTLERIPEIDFEVIDAHYASRYRSQKDLDRFTRNTEDALKKNENLGYLIHAIAKESNDPCAVYKAVFTILDLIEAQLEVDELNQTAELEYKGK
jgi:hypothetical protein